MKLLPAKLLLLAVISFSCVCAKCSGPQYGGEQEQEPKPEPDVPSLDIEAGDIEAQAASVADWQIANFSYPESGSPGMLHDRGIGAWTNATLYAGMLRWADIAPEPGKYLDWLMDIGEKSAWAVPANFVGTRYGIYHADELCIGQFYLGMYEKYGEPRMLAGVSERVAAIMANPPGEDMAANVKQSWTWCDALFMAPPVYTALAAVEGDGKPVAFMDMLFKRTYNYLYNTADGLFFRDDTYFDQKEANGERIYWGRGNGWVAAGLVNILRTMPVDSGYRPFYEDLFRRFVPRLAELQDEDGFWHASLLDPDAYPAPETSATALITYAIAYGVNSGLLDAATYTPAVEKGWRALETTVAADGRVGWVQPIGASPGSVTQNSTAVYGAGAVLMAATEVHRLADNP
jgi:rhamnogalacturonyl hydrolase YesR